MLTPFERGLSYLSPRAAGRRFMARMQLEQVERVFDAAKVGRRTEGWLSTGSSANSEAGPALDRLRFRSRDLERNNPLAGNFLRLLPAHIVGARVTARPVGFESSVAATVRANWNTFCDNSDLSGGTNFDAQMSLGMRSVVRDGEVLFVWQVMPDTAKPLTVHVLEADYLDTAKSITLGNGNIVIQGVEFDKDGRRVAYWLFDQHPGETLIANRANYLSKRVDAALVDHVFDVTRPGQARGIPWLAPAALRMRDMSEFEEAELVRKKVEACFAAFVTKTDDGGTSPIATVEDPNADPKSPQKRLARLSPGLIHYLRNNEEVTFGTPRQGDGGVEYLKWNAQMCCVGMGIPYFMGAGDLTGVNFTSSRAGQLQFFQLVDHWQWHMAVPMVYQRAWNRVHEAYGRLGAGPKGLVGVEWAMPERQMVDVATQGEADARELRMGGQTWRQYVAKKGLDPDTQLEQLKEQPAELAGANLDFSAAGAQQLLTPDSGLNDNAP